MARTIDLVTERQTLERPTKILPRLVVSVILSSAFANPVAADESQAGAIDIYGDPLPSGAGIRLGTIRYRHPGWYKHIEFVLGKSQFVVCTRDNSPRLWDARSGKLFRQLTQVAVVLQGSAFTDQPVPL